MNAALQAEPMTVDALCGALDGIVARLGLPGRSKSDTASQPSRVGNNGEEKTPWPAPSAERLRRAVALLPNDKGHFDDRDAFVSVCHAIKGAAIAEGCEAEGKVAFLDWASRWNGHADPAHDERLWDGCRNPHTGWGTLMRLLERSNPAGGAEIKAQEMKAAFAKEAAKNAGALSANPIKPVEPFDPTKILPRRWLYGRCVVAGFHSMLVAPGGQGKSALAMAEAVAMATGRELLKGEKPIRPLRVWYHNGEDDMNEQGRRLAAAMCRHAVTHANLGGRLILTSGRELDLKLARMGKSGPEIVPGVVESMVNKIEEHTIDVLILDPLGAMHSLPENANEAMNLLLGALREIMARTGVAIVILHHTSKGAATDMASAGANASRGASALVDGARVVRQLARMSDKEARDYGISDSDRRDYVRVDNGKANLARAEDGRWLRLASVSLFNSTREYPDGDHVVTVERWTPPVPQPGTATELAQVQTAIANAPSPPRANHLSPKWAGWLIAQTLGLDIGGPKRSSEDRSQAQAAAHRRVCTLIKGWLKDGSLIKSKERDPKARREFDCIVVGTPAVLADQPSGPVDNQDQEDNPQ